MYVQMYIAIVCTFLFTYNKNLLSQQKVKYLGILMSENCDFWNYTTAVARNLARNAPDYVTESCEHFPRIQNQSC